MPGIGIRFGTGGISIGPHRGRSTTTYRVSGSHWACAICHYARRASCRAPWLFDSWVDIDGSYRKLAHRGAYDDPGMGVCLVAVSRPGRRGARATRPHRRDPGRLGKMAACHQICDLVTYASLTCQGLRKSLATLVNADGERYTPTRPCSAMHSTPRASGPLSRAAKPHTGSATTVV